MFSCYDFGPDDATFQRPIDVIIRYNVDDLPDGVEESDIKVYVLNGNTLEPIEDSFANKAMHWTVVSVSHFSKMGGGAPAPSGGSSSGDGDNGSADDKNNSAQYWFKANINYYSYHSPRLSETNDHTIYYVGAAAYWDPVSYVQYYEIKFVFNGNLPEDYAWSCSYRGQEKCSSIKSYYPINEGYIYNMGGDPELKGFLSTIKTGEAIAKYIDPDTGEVTEQLYGRSFPEGKHGYNFMGINDRVYDYEELSAIEIGSLVSDMETFIQQYINNWEVWVRGVTETQE